MSSNRQSDEMTATMSSNGLGARGCDQPSGRMNLPRRGEIVFAVLAVLLACVLRIRYASQIGFNSDEPQHLHVVWGWTAGLLQYRDVFDNHAPLFDMLLAPVLRLFGERGEILIWMRLAMLPLFLLSLWAVFDIGKSVFSPRAGVWAMVLAVVFPHFEREDGGFTADALFFFKMGEFRTDVLWSAVWLCGLAVLLRGRLSVGRCFFFGVILGAALSVSMKTVLMLVAVLAAATVLCALVMPRGKKNLALEPVQMAGAAVLGLFVVPLLIVTYFAAKHGLDAMYYCIVTHNKMPGTGVLDRARHSWRYLLPRVLALVALAAWMIRRRGAKPEDPKRAFLVMIGGFYYLAVCGLWPIITPQDFQPSDPIFALCITPLLLLAGDYLAGRLSISMLRGVPAGAAVVAGFGMILHEESLFQHRTTDEVAMVGDVLRLTEPGEQVIDAKGECIYRPRGWYMVLETIARKKLRLNLIKDDLIETTVAKRIPLAHGLERMLEGDREWFEQHYLQVGHVLVLGEMLKAEGGGGAPFDIVIPETYRIVADSGAVHGILDGQPVNGPMRLEAGHHLFLSQDRHAARRFAVVWERAVEKGYSPFGGVPNS